MQGTPFNVKSRCYNQDTGTYLKHSCCGIAKKLDTVGRRGEINYDSTEDIETDLRAQWEVD